MSGERRSGTLDRGTVVLLFGVPRGLLIPNLYYMSKIRGDRKLLTLLNVKLLDNWHRRPVTLTFLLFPTNNKNLIWSKGSREPKKGGSAIVPLTNPVHREKVEKVGVQSFQQISLVNESHQY